MAAAKKGGFTLDIGNLTAPAAPPRRRMNLTRESAIAAAVFMAPALLSLLIWFIYPFLQSIFISFFDYSYMHPDTWNFVGIDNYARMFADPDFYVGLAHTLLFVAVVVPVQTVLALLLATLVNQKIRGRGFFRTAYYMPYVLSAVAVATVFMYFFVKGEGLANVFALFGLPNVTWFADVNMAMPFIGLLYIWQMLGFYMIYYLAGLQTISASIYEAAEIDGANKLQTFFRITVPNLRHTTFLVITYGIIQSFQLYDQIAVVTAGRGGVGTPAGATTTLLTLFYNESFKYYRMGYGSAIAIVLFCIILLVSVIQRRLTKAED
jgi:multiple sugar transport system permease protein